MPNLPHEILHHIFREDSQLFSRVLRLVEVSFPEPQEIRVGNIDTTEIRKVLERRIDTVIEAQTEEGPFLIAIEAQNKKNKLKLRNWAYYPAYLHELKGCPVVVIVVCRDLVTAAWAREPYCIGLRERPTLVSTPIVIGPNDLPRFTNTAKVIADPYMAALSALVYARDPEIDCILEALADALPKLDEGLSKQLFELIERGLQDTPALDIWRKVMSHIPLELLPRSRWARRTSPRDSLKDERKASRKVGPRAGPRGRAEGQAKGMVEAVLRILDRRHIELPTAVRAQISACTDIEMANTWLDEALTVVTFTEMTGLDEA